LHPPADPQQRFQGFSYVILAVLFFSTSPVFVRWAAPISPFAITGGRMLVAAGALGLVVLLTRRGRSGPAGHAAPRTRRASILRFLGYGAIAALHFLCYTASLSFTTPAQALALVYTAPIFVSLFAALFLREPIRPRQWAGIMVAVVGIAVLALGKTGDTQAPNPLLGDLLALGSAITFGLYSIAGRYERAHTPLLLYAARVYSVAALGLLPLALLTMPADLGGVPPLAWGSIVALGLLPLALGHTLYNASLRRVPATVVNVIATQEVTGGVLLTWLLQGVAPTGNEVVGGAITLLGILIVLL
jgi:drug/metabolite transporter (DMT)-like permease